MEIISFHERLKRMEVALIPIDNAPHTHTHTCYPNLFYQNIWRPGHCLQQSPLIHITLRKYV
jgi:hypothetical protein